MNSVNLKVSISISINQSIKCSMYLQLREERKRIIACNNQTISHAVAMSVNSVNKLIK